MTTDALARLARLEDALEQVPTIVLHLREQAMPSMQGGQDGKISGSKEVASPPLRVEPIDEADELWAVLWELIDELLEKGSECFCTLRSLQTVRARQSRAVHAGVEVVRGYASSNSARIQVDSAEVSAWLHARASRLAFGSAFTASVDQLCDRVDRLRAQVGSFSTYRFQAYRTWPCPRCGRYEVLPTFGPDGLVADECDYCTWRRDVVRG